MPRFTQLIPEPDIRVREFLVIAAICILWVIWEKYLSFAVMPKFNEWVHALWRLLVTCLTVMAAKTFGKSCATVESKVNFFGIFFNWCVQIVCMSAAQKRYWQISICYGQISFLLLRQVIWGWQVCLYCCVSFVRHRTPPCDTHLPVDGVCEPACVESNNANPYNGYSHLS